MTFIDPFLLLTKTKWILFLVFIWEHSSHLGQNVGGPKEMNKSSEANSLYC